MLSNQVEISILVSAQKKDRKLVSIPLHVHIDDGMFFEVTQPDSIRYTYKVRPAKNFGGVFVSIGRIVFCVSMLYLHLYHVFYALDMMMRI